MKIINGKKKQINEILSNMDDFLNDKTKKKIRDAIENVDYSKPKNRKNLSSFLKGILLKHKDMIIKTRKVTKNKE